MRAPFLAPTLLFTLSLPLLSGCGRAGLSPADFGAEDAEGRVEWVRAAGVEPEGLARLADPAFASEDLGAAVEQVILREPALWSRFGPVLITRQDPRWIRTAVHCLLAVDQGARDAALSSLRSAPGPSLAWLDEHLDDLSPVAWRLWDALRQEGVTALPGPALGRLEDRELCPGLVGPPADAARTLGSIRIFVGSERRPWEGVDGLGRLVEGSDEALRAAALGACPELDPPHVPTVQLLAGLQNAELSPERRLEYWEAFLCGAPYAVYVESVGIAVDPAHPLWTPAVRVLERSGDRFAADRLRDLSPEALNAEQKALLGQALSAIDARSKAETIESLIPRVQGMLECIVYADLTVHPQRQLYLGELMLEIHGHFDSYDYAYRVKEVMVKYRAAERPGLRVDSELFRARMEQRCVDLLSM